MAYRFRLQTLLDYRASLEEEARLRLGREQHQLERQRRALEELGQRRQRVVEAFEEAKRQTLPASRFSYFYQTIAGIDEAMARQRQTIAAQEQVVAEARQQLAAAMRERQIMERLRDRDLAAFLAEERRREQNVVDELMMLRFGRNENLLREGGA